ncbi:iron-containing alcohol dehydrogenase [Coriobacteriales bacterium OH1046]|nr:iron-containing alcohol dehydrogenase [Coriobacteriales bacterium OH1046]
MEDFIFNIPTQIVFGKETHKRVGQLISSRGYKRILFVYDSGKFLQENGLLDEVGKTLAESKLEVTELTGIRPNPLLSKVHEGVEIAKKNRIEFVLAMGGGSTIDTAKAIAVGAVEDGDVWDHFYSAIGVSPIFEALPVGTILTIAATGSETNCGMMITNDETGLKRGAGGPGAYPIFSILNPEITYSLPAYQTAAGVCDMYTHVTERYFTNTKNTYVVDAMAEGILRTLYEIGPKLLKDPKNYDLRAEVMWIGTISHNDTVGVGRVQDWATHDLGYEITDLYNLTHGATVTIMLIAWMKYVFEHDINRFGRYAKFVFGIDPQGRNRRDVAYESVLATEAFFKEMGMPTRFSEAGIDEPDVERMAETICKERDYIGNFIQLKHDDIEKVYKLAM